MRSGDTDSRELADLKLDGERRCLTGPGGRIRLEPKVFAVLATLADRHGRVVSRDHLLETVWAGRVVSDAALTVVVGQVRRALRRAGTGCVTIETVAGRGYELGVSHGAGRRRGAAWLAYLRPAVVAMLVLLIPAGMPTTGNQVLLNMMLTRPSGDRMPMQVVVGGGSDAALHTEYGEERFELSFDLVAMTPRQVLLRITSSSGERPMTFRTSVAFGTPVQLRVPAGPGRHLGLEVEPRRLNNAFRHFMKRNPTPGP